MFLRVCVWFFVLLWAEPVIATDNYAYRTDEYAVISGGRSPDGHWSIAAHGDNSYGYDGFRLYLMREPAHEKLKAFNTRDHLDTGPLSIVGLWAPNSSHVVVLYRTDRHVLDMKLFDVANGKVRSVKIPSLVDMVGQHHFISGIHPELSGRHYRVAWQKSDRLALKEFDTFDAPQPIFSPGLEAYLEVERWNAERTFTSFSASAVYEIAGQHKPRLLSMKPLPGRDGTIVYSPHLCFDPELGLHDTETPLSSLAAQKDRQ